MPRAVVASKAQLPVEAPTGETMGEDIPDDDVLVK